MEHFATGHRAICGPAFTALSSFSNLSWKCKQKISRRSQVTRGRSQMPHGNRSKQYS